MKKAPIALVCALLAGCNSLPGDGPLADDIIKQAEQSRTGTTRKNSVVFDVVEVDAASARLVSNYDSILLQRRFGIGGGAGQPVIGIGDELKVTIFEAGSDGLFSTADSKQTSIGVVVQPNGKAAIPYVGEITFRGKTLEQARQTILDALKGKAVEPDVIVASGNSASRSVAVSGAVGRASVVPMGLRGQTIMETLAVQAGDQLFVTRDPRTFTVLGSVKSNSRIEFGANDLNLLEAVALAHGAAETTSDMKGYFIFRYEEADIVRDLLGAQRFRQLVANGMQPDKNGHYPVVYRFDMSRPDSLIFGQTFPIKNRDIIYASRHPSVDFARFIDMVARPVGIAGSGIILANGINN